MLARIQRPQTALALVLALAASPVVAQSMSAKDAWSGLRGLAAGAGLTISSTGATDFGGSFAATGVRIFPTEDPNAVVISMDELRIEPRGDLIALIPSALIRVSAQAAGGERREFEITHDGEIRGALSETNAALDLDFDTLMATMVQGATTGGERFSMSFAGLDATLRAAREGSADIEISAGSMTYDVSFTDRSGPRPAVSVSTATIQTPRVTFSGTELDTLSGDDGMLPEAFRAGMSMRLAITAGPSTGQSEQEIAGTPIRMQSEGGASSVEVTVADGRFDVEIGAEGGRIAGSSGPMAGEATYDGVGLNLGFPLVVTAENQPMRYAFNFDNITPSPDLLTMLGFGTFAGDSLSLALDLAADGRLTRELDADAMASPVPPFDLSTVRLDNVLIRVGDSEFTGAGAVTLIGGLMAQIGRDIPDANGDLTFNLVGGERLLTRLSSMGLVPNDQLFFVRMMMNGLGRPVGDDSLQSDVAIRPGGVVTVNGAPLPF